MRKLICNAAIAAALAGIGSASAQTFPTRPITMVVPFAAGEWAGRAGATIGALHAERLGQPVIIENITGAGGMTGSARVAKGGRLNTVRW
jgi:tripartite-type tricarboxylate transporter receptor subunit TctC